MNILVALGISIGILAGVWTEISLVTGLATWGAFVAWAAFFAAGGGVDGFKKTLAANMSGVFWGFVILFINGLIGGIPFALGISVVIGAFAMCVQAKFDILSFIPGAFLGCATYFATGGDILAAIIPLVCGVCLAFASEVWGNKMAKKDA